MVAVANTKMMVRPTSRMLRAISFGVFWRSAPSTRAIMRSRKVSPGFEVILTLIQSEITLVPPVTAERSPPDSRITGALSPVMAASSTEATPSTTSPSPGIMSPATISPTSPRPAADDAVRRRLGLGPPQGVGLRLAAPLGHRLGEVGEQHREPEPERHLDGEPEVRRLPGGGV